MTRSLMSLARDRKGSSAVEFSIAIPILLSMIWGILQLSLIFEANAGMTNALGQAARLATIYPTPSDTAIQDQITSSKFGLLNGTWSTPTIATSGTTKTISVSYSQPLDFLFFRGPTVTLTKTKVVNLST
jgi:Flp pilus assembly protein TadG